MQIRRGPNCLSGAGSWESELFLNGHLTEC